MGLCHSCCTDTQLPTWAQDTGLLARGGPASAGNLGERWARGNGLQGDGEAEPQQIKPCGGEGQKHRGDSNTWQRTRLEEDDHHRKRNTNDRDHSSREQWAGWNSCCKAANT